MPQKDVIACMGIEAGLGRGGGAKVKRKKLKGKRTEELAAGERKEGRSGLKRVRGEGQGVKVERKKLKGKRTEELAAGDRKER
jgi:hypothetical protein